MSIGKLDGAVVNSDTWHTARLTTTKIIEEIKCAVREKLMMDDQQNIDPMVLQQDCHHHLRNVWIGAITKRLSQYLNEILACDLNVIDLSFFVLSHRPCQWDFLMKLWFIWIC